MVIATALWGTALLCLMLGCVLIAASAWVRRFRGASTRTEVALDIAVAAMALCMFEVSVLVLLGLGTLLPVAAALVGTGCLALWLDGRAALAQLGEVTRAGLAALRRSWALWLVALLGLLTLARGITIPQLSWDGLTYHLGYPASWIKHGGVVRLEGGGCWETYETFPKGTEALYFLAMVPFGRDFLVNLVNLPAWLGMGLAIRASCQRIGVSRRGQDVCVLVVLACPVFYAYVTPAYVEITKGLAFCAMIAAGLRALDTRDARMLVPMCIALGAGLCIKLTALSWGGFPLILALLTARADARAAVRYALFGALLGGMVAAPWYIHNVVLCDNPIYPAPLPGFGDAGGGAAGSLQAKWSMEETSVLSQGSLDRVIAYLRIPPWGARYPMGPFWAYLGSMALWPLLLLVSRGPARRWAVGLGVFAFYMLDIYLLTPYNGVYVDADTRFLGPSFVAAVLACAAALTSLPVPIRLGVAALAVANALAYLPLTPTLRELEAAHPAMAVAACLAAALLSATLPRMAGTRRAALASGAFALAAYLLLPVALYQREQDRFHHYDKSYDLHQVPPASKSLWETVAELPASKLAFSIGGIDYTEAWFFYPLFGPDLRHTVTYVDIEVDGDVRACQRRGMIRDEPNREAWLARLARERIDYLVLRGEPVEDQWARELPERFLLRKRTPSGALYRVLR